MAKKKNYIDNERFLNEMVEYRNSVIYAKDNKLEKPIVNDYIGECFYKIAEKLSHKDNFISYYFRDEMISDAVENCLRYIDNFDPSKSTNPFAYFTQIIYYAFLRKIEREKKQLYIKYKAIDEHKLMNDGIDTGVNDTDSYNMTINNDYKNNIYEFIENFEIKKKKINKKRRDRYYDHKDVIRLLFCEEDN